MKRREDSTIIFLFICLDEEKNNNNFPFSCLCRKKSEWKENMLILNNFNEIVLGKFFILSFQYSIYLIFFLVFSSSFLIAK